MKNLAQMTMSLVLLAGAIEAHAVTIYSQDLNANDGGYTVSNTGPVLDPWTYSGAGPNGNWFTNGTDNLNLPGIPSSSALTSPTINVTTGGPLTLSFAHLYNVERDTVRWDGGAVFVSVNAGAFTQVPAASFTANGYDGIIEGNNALNGLSGFNGVSGSPAAFTPGAVNGTFLVSTASLGSFNAGDTLQLRFLGAWDEFAEGNLPNWEITSVQLEAAAVIPEPASALFGVLSLAALAKRRRAAKA